MALNIQALAAKAKEAGLDQTKVATGGTFTRDVPVEGPCMLRFVGYVELGQKETTYQGQKKKKNEVQLTFEVHGPKYPVKEHEGKKYPVLITVTESLTQSDKGNWLPLFKALNYSSKATHAVELLGEAYKGRIYHKKYKRKTDPADKESWTGIEVGFRNPDSKAYSFAAPVKEDEETGETTQLNVPQAISPIRAFLWNAPDMEQWDSIHIPGEWPEKKDEKTGEVIFAAKSKNVIQQRIRAAVNYGGSPINYLLANAGKELDLDTSALDEDEAPEGGGDEANPLAGVSDAAPATVKKPAGKAKAERKLDDLEV
jgi:hypothetical protein